MSRKAAESVDAIEAPQTSELGVEFLCICRDGRIDYVNHAGVRLLGYDDPDRMIGRSLASFLGKEAADIAAPGRLEAFAASGLPRLLPLIAADGGTVEVAVTAHIIVGDPNRPILLHGQQIDEWVAIEALRERERRLQGVVDAVGEGIITADRNGVIQSFNPAAGRIFGYSAGEVIGRNLSLLLKPLEDGDQGDHISTFLRTGLTKRLGIGREATGWRKDGTSLPLEINVTALHHGRQRQFIVILHDITERKGTEEKLRLAAAVFETTAEGIMVLDAEFRITAVNPSFTAITGHAAASVIGRKPEFLAADGTDGHLQEAIDNAVRLSGRWDHEQWSRRRSGEEYAERLSVTAIHDDEGHVTRYVVVFSDITQRKLDEERIRYQANYDALTGLPNRALFMDRLTQAIIAAERSQQKVAVMFIDLDGFKLVNDTLGHDVGDDLLKEAARRLLASVRAGDTVARLGGDEFTVIMPNLADLRNAPVVAQRIIESLELPFRLKTHEAFVSASIGITAYPDDASDVNSLLKNADAAMYQAKEQGKANFQFFTAALNAQVSERLVIKNGLSKALERNEFMLYYQPKIELASGKLTGVEALLRWRSAELGMVSPAKFIPVTEETGLISAVGEWALITACEQHRKWRDAGFPHMRVAVNLSVRQLRQPNLTRSIAGILDRAGVDPSCLELEITESMIMKDTENAVVVLRSLSDMGIRLAMDDFGTGYSSLSYLKRFPLHAIKIDRSFIHDIAVDPDDLEIIRTIITMGHSLRRRIIAEGVETEEQLSLLRKLHCDEIQGYLLSPPVPAAEIDRMLEARPLGADA